MAGRSGKTLIADLNCWEGDFATLKSELSQELHLCRLHKPYQITDLTNQWSPARLGDHIDPFLARLIKY
jgi:hypothetical protein